ncbi:16S rRNA (cytosine(967)-C(5))-methyltransferase RsmB [Paludifilum halophilum]|uniref:16S rRNA (cytosine(967)-C(5))-methyltransferase n=1 Tax=Paludifilum halophilum TaxID=1642702 RepID=A0A235B2A4_9BACL|nr:16S rRNA (cytosine(967)-C(5))-methyltransferase RsmB [Paludifilum halophilum]OYD06414.1 16S rRNA (cytosine(967)-C(5))-methyltransferase [Paludifilum halophilum]
MENRMNARHVALDILIQWEERDGYSNLLLNESLNRSRLGARDRGLATELVYGTVQRRNTLDWILNSLLKQDLSTLDVWVAQLLRLSVYQMRYLDKIPSRAAVHEAVDIAKQRGHKGVAGLVNGVLRSYLRRKEEWRLPDPPKTVREWALAYSHPKWMVRRFQAVYGEEEARRILEADNRPPEISLRTQPLKNGRKALMDDLQGEYPEAQIRPSLLSEQGIVFRGGGNPAASPLYREGRFTIQDESSMLVSELVAPRPGQRGADLCAAPGGKSTHLAEQMRDQGDLFAYDFHPHKVRLIEENAERLGLSSIEAEAEDARRLPEKSGKSFDFVLLDAPCSGLGVIRRKPDIKWRKEPREIDELVRLQKELLEAAAELIVAGGVLVYSTCTMEPRENEEQIRDFLRTHPDFSIDPSFENRLPEAVRQKGWLRKNGVQILPHHFGSDGFFITRLIRNE